MPSEIRLHPEAIRQRAQSIQECREIAFSEELKVLSFLVSKDTESETSKEQIARVNIYYQTGTVGVCHVIHNEIREYFHKKVNTHFKSNII